MKKVAEIFIRKPVMSIMILTSLCLLGTIAVYRLPVGLLPNLLSPGITIITRYSGVSAARIEEFLTIPLERQVSDIPGIEKIISISSEGESKINLIFEHDSDIKIKILETNERINLIRDSFPREVEEPYIIQYDPTNRPVFIVSFASNQFDLKKLREIIDKQVKLRYERLPGVSEVFVGGGFEREVQILIDPVRLSAYGISLAPLMKAVQAANTFVPGGKLAGSGESNIYIKGKFKNLTEIRDINLPMNLKGGSIKLARIAEIQDRYRDRTTIARTNGEERVTVYVQKAGNANTLVITEESRRITSALQLDGIESQIVYDQGRFIRAAIRRVSSACVFGGLIAILILYLFLQRAAITLVVALTIPCSILTTFFLMYISHIEINIMSLSGLALGAGMLIDNSIVVAESINSRLSSHSKYDAVYRGTMGVFSEIIAATLTTIVVFIPLIFTNPETRLLYQGLTLTVIYSLMVSLLFSITILPSLLYFVLVGFDKKDPQKKNLSKVFNMEIIKKRYRIICRPIFNNIRLSVSIPILFFASAPFLFSSIKKEYSGPLDSGSIEATVDLKTGTHLEKTQEVVRRIEKIIRSHPGVMEINSRIEKWHATLNIKLKRSGYGSDEQLLDELKAKTAEIREAFVYYTRSTEGAGGQELNIEFYGDDIKILKDFASQMAGAIKGQIRGVQQTVLRFREPKGDIIIRPDKTVTALAGTTVTEVGNTIRHLLTGAIITKFYDQDREVDVRIRAPENVLQTPEQLKSLLIPLPGRSLPLSEIASFSTGEGETRIWRKNKRKLVSITVRMQNRSTDEIATAIELLFRKTKFPTDVIYAFGDEYRKFQETQKEMLFAIVISLLIIYLLLGALFESFVQPFLILITVPIALIGILFIFYIFGMTLNMSVYIGFIMLGGIAVNNSILVVSTINSHVGRASNVTDDRSLIEMILDASALRLRPILMTTMTTILGISPMIFDFSEGSALFRPLAITVALGMFLSLAVSLVLVPFASYLFQRTVLKKKLNM